MEIATETFGRKKRKEKEKKMHRDSPRNSTRPMRFDFGFGRRNSKMRTVNDIFAKFLAFFPLHLCVYVSLVNLLFNVNIENTQTLKNWFSTTLHSNDIHKDDGIGAARSLLLPPNGHTVQSTPCITTAIESTNCFCFAFLWVLLLLFFFFFLFSYIFTSLCLSLLLNRVSTVFHITNSVSLHTTTKKKKLCHKTTTFKLYIFMSYLFNNGIIVFVLKTNRGTCARTACSR